MNRKVWDNLTETELKDLWMQNKTGEIAVMFGVSFSAAYNRIKRLHFRKRGPVNQVWRNLTWSELHGLIVVGLTYTEIGRLFGVSKSAVAGKVYWFRRKQNASLNQQL